MDIKVTYKRKTLKSRLVVVIWVDSSLQNVQVGKDDFPKPEVIETAGWLVEETDEYLTVARDDMKHDEFRGLCCIPWDCVRERIFPCQ